MSDTYLITAKTVEEAIAIANREYADESHEISYEIIDMPKKGFLGLGAKDAKIKVTVSKSVSADLNSLVADLRGMKVLTAKGDDGDNRRDKNQKHGDKNKNNQQKNRDKGDNRENGDKNNNRQNQQRNQQNKDRRDDRKQNGEKPQQNQQKQAEKTPQQTQQSAPQKQESRSSLKNQGKPNRRQPQKHFSGDNGIEATSFTVSAPMGLSDFVADEKKNTFGAADGDNSRSTGRMNNDIRRGKNKGGRKDNGEKVIFENRNEMITRYDVAESDEDYKKLDKLEDRELTIDEIRDSVRATSTVRGESGISADVLDAAIEAAIDIAPKAEKIKREAVSRAEMDFALEFANRLLANMGLSARAEEAQCPEDEEFIVSEECTVYPKINIVGDDTGILIGHHGETLDAIQYLVNLSALRRSKQKDGDYVKIVVDIENYRHKREETLRALARRMAVRAVKYKKNVFLEPMNAYERRIIHSELQDVPNVSTHSVGTDRDRKIIVTYEGPDKVADNRRGRKRGHGKNGGGNQPKSTVKENAENTASSEEKERGKRNRHRPRKAQKMPIEKIGEILPDGESAPSEE